MNLLLFQIHANCAMKMCLVRHWSWRGTMGINVIIYFKVSEGCSVMSDSLRPHGYTVHGILQDRILEWVAFSFSRGSSQTRYRTPGLPHCRWVLHQLSHKGSPRILEWVAYPFSSRSSRPRNQTGVLCIAGGFFTN